MKYTLYYQPLTASDRKIAVVTSDSLLKLCKIQKMTFYHHGKGHTYIVETASANDKDAYLYGAGLLFDDEYDEFLRFVKKVDKGKCYASYDYSQRVRALLNGRS